MLKVGSVYKITEDLMFGFGDRRLGKWTDKLIPPESCLLFLFFEIAYSDMESYWIYFFYDNKIIFRASSIYDFEWFIEVI